MLPILASQILGGLGPELADSYPSDSTFVYDMLFLPGGSVSNMAQNREAMRQQTLDEHNAALMQYVRPGMDPLQMRWAIEKGKEAERNLPQFWDDSKPLRTTHATSNAVSGVRINPDNSISVQFGGRGKWYTYRGGVNRQTASVEAQKLLSSPDIERAINRNGSWALTHKLY